MGAFVDKVAGKLKRVDNATIQSMKLEPQQEMNYKDRRIILPKTEGEVLEPIKVLRAGMAAPTAANKQPWHFVAVNNKEKLAELAGRRGMIKQAGVAIIVCGNLDKARSSTGSSS